MSRHRSVRKKGSTGRWPIRVAWLLACLLVLGASGHRAAPVAGNSGRPTTFGVLATGCDPALAGAEQHAGIRTAVIDFSWAQYEPQQGQFDSAYAGRLRRQVEACRAAGLQVILGLGLQYPPDWVRQLPDGRFTDQYGNPSSAGEANLVFSQAVRDGVTGYLQQVSTDIGLGNFTAIRVGTSQTAELGYPGPVEGHDQSAHDFWAFDTAAQTGSGLPAGISPTPMPGWVPGMLRWRGQPVDAHQTTAWFQWYTSALTEAVSWQMRQLQHLGFTGVFHVPTAGRGALPHDLNSALTAHLDGRGDPDGNLERGLDYPSQFPTLATLDKRLNAANSTTHVVVDFTGLDDNTAVRARALLPPQDRCRPGDTTNLLARTDVESWANQRWTIANAHLAGLGVVGENPGPPTAPRTGGSARSDSEAQQLDMALSYATSCDLEGFQFAFESELFANDPGVSLADYGSRISQRLTR